MAVVQSVDARYIDGPKLLALLKNLFGTGNFSFDHANDSYTLTIPRSLTDEEQKSVQSSSG